MQRIAVTTSTDDCILISRARDIAIKLDIPYIARNKKSLEKTRLEHNLDGLIVVEKNGVLLKNNETLFWHPNMAVPRLKAIREGHIDPMLEAMDLKSGYKVLDCTLGLAADALVMASALGEEGKVIGLEDNKFIAFITKWGLNNFKGRNTRLYPLLKRISVLNISYEDYLKAQAADSFDVVYFDPMFRHGRYQSSSLTPIRLLANKNPVSLEYIEEALRVCRHRVVLKERKHCEEFIRLNAHYIVGGKYSPVAYGVWEKLQKQE